jgi:predicted DNA-binding antitoxin AbrB/MazE fold protein
MRREGEDYTMPKIMRAVVREGKIELLDPVELPEGASVLVTLVPDAEMEFWLHASQPSLDAIWDNPEDDVYGKLLEE